MNEQLIKEIDRAIKALQSARVALTATQQKRGPGRPKKTVVAKAIAPVAAKRGVMTEEGKARIAAAQKKRWAKIKRAAKKAARLAEGKA
jgi:hypothetical protein